MPKEELKGVVTQHGDKTGPSGRRFAWFTVNKGMNKGWVRVIGFYPEGIGPRCLGLEHVESGTHVVVSGKTKNDIFFADTVTKVSRPYGKRNDPPAKPGPWKIKGVVVRFQPGKEKDWLEIVTDEGDQVPASMKTGVLGPGCLSKTFEFSGIASRNGFRHGREARALEDA